MGSRLETIWGDQDTVYKNLEVPTDCTDWIKTKQIQHGSHVQIVSTVFTIFGYLSSIFMPG